MAHVLSLDDIEAMAVGAWILGTGGGGTPYHGLISMRELYRAGRRVQLRAPEELEDDELVTPLSIVGAPLVFQERLTDSRLIAQAVRRMENYVALPITGVMPIEIGGGNAFQPLLASAELGLDLVDADAMGRAYPEAQMTSFAVHNLDPAPLVAVDPRGNEVIISKVANWSWMERIGRKICAEFGSMATTCKAPRTGREVKQCGISGSISRAIAMGRCVLDARASHTDPVEALIRAEQGKLLFVGVVDSVERKTTEGFLRGSAKLRGVDSYKMMQMELAFQNEWTIAWINETPAATTPDLICVLDTESGEAIGTDMLRYGQRASVVAFDAPLVFRKGRGLELVGPSAFGYDIPYTPVFP